MGEEGAFPQWPPQLLPSPPQSPQHMMVLADRYRSLKISPLEAPPVKSKMFHKAQNKINSPKQSTIKHIHKQKEKASWSSTVLEEQTLQRRRLERCK